MNRRRNALWLGLLAITLPLAAIAAPQGLQPEQLATMDRYSSPVLTPDGAKVIFAKRVVDPKTYKASTALYSKSSSGTGKATQITPAGMSVNSPAISADGKTLYFMSSKNGSSQIYSVPVSGGTPVALTALPLDVGGFAISPDGKKVAITMEAYADCSDDLKCTVDRNKTESERKTTGVVYDRMFVRHWDAWNEGKLNRIYVSPLTAPIKDAKMIGSSLKADTPSRPFGDLSEMAWSPDSSSIVVSARVADRDEPRSTNFDLYQIPADGSAAPRNLTAANKAWDTAPQFSKDGKTLYYRAMKRPGFEADRWQLMEMDLASGKTREIAPRWDRSAENTMLVDGGKSLLTVANDLGQNSLFKINIANNQVTPLISKGTVNNVAVAGNKMIYTMNSLQSGDQIFVSDLNGANAKAITPSASEILGNVKFGEAEQFTFKGWNNETVHGYVVKPWNYVEGQKYPVAFLIHGGPQGSFGNGWSYRWNPQTYAGQGYAVVMIDFHGSTGYGQAFTDSISQHWGDRPLEDLQKGWKAAQQKYSFLNGDKACALGASYGGYMVNWIAGNWNQPWKCLVSHDGVFDQRMMGYATEELWFTEWENGGSVINNAKNYEKFNPVNHTKNWKVPMLVIHGQLDYRIPVEQGLAAFTALQLQNVPSQFLYFPDENHWVLKPQNSIQWHNTVNSWLRNYIGSDSR